MGEMNWATYGVCVQIIESYHWQKKKKYRRNIELHMIEYAINSSEKYQKDAYHKNAVNTTVVVPETGRRLKVIFRKLGKQRVKLITAYYID